MDFRPFEVARAQAKGRLKSFSGALWRAGTGGYTRCDRVSATCGLGEGFMGLKAIGAVLLASAVALAAVAADAATTKRKPTRVVVTKRSYLDAGTEVKPGERHFTDYVFPPNYSPYSVVDPTRSYRYPLPDSFWLPGCCGGPQGY
jgi:hypothetical protein